MSASISSWWWWLKLACVSIFWPFWPNNSFVTGNEECCYFEAEFCEGEVICLFAHNWHFIFRSSTVLVQIFRLQTDNWFFLFSLLSSHILTRSICCIQSHREAKSHFLGFLEHLWRYNMPIWTSYGALYITSNVSLTHLRLYGLLSELTPLLHWFPDIPASLCIKFLKIR